jgi:hypothetical protein
MSKIKRRELIAGIGAAAIASAVPTAASGQTAPRRVTLPLVSSKAISHKEREIEGGKEATSVIELIGANGAKEVHTTLVRATLNTMVVVTHTNHYNMHTDNEPSAASLVTLIKETTKTPKGIQIRSTVIDAGGIRPSQTITYKSTPSAEDLKGLEGQELLDAIFRKKGLIQ